MNILALDQARNGAWSVFNYEKKNLVGSGYFSFESNKYTYPQAIAGIEDLMGLIIEAYEVEAVFLEDIQLRANVQAFKKLAQLQGVLVNYLERNEFMYGFVAPTQWQCFCESTDDGIDERILASSKSKAVSERKKSKLLSIQFIKDRFDIDTDNDNLADAICIGWFVVNEAIIDKSTKTVVVPKKTKKRK